ncbi:MAG: rod shape-determining protein RodA [Alphaproteobacteria bacterium]|nr:MAG: rod shape-determining protein RodA [Alphaproteobacteria bacterium]
MTEPAISLKGKRGLFTKFGELNWFVVLLITAIACVGFVMLYSVAGGSIEPWASRQMIRFAVGLVLMIAVALTSLRFWVSAAYPIYLGALALLIAVEFIGTTGMGAQRWIDLGFFRLQPSEVMKIALVLALARYYHGITMREAMSLRSLLIPVILIALPAGLVLSQPDLGTALLLILGGAAVMFLAGVRLWLFVAGIISALAAIPVAWGFLKDYQKSRILTFLNPERDPLGAGYHIMQSKIALGSGGVYGKGFLLGTQSQLNFLPEKQTDFIFTMLAEEFGLLGGLGLLTLYGILIGYAILVSLTIRSHFGRLMAMGLAFTFFLYVFINTAMVMGLLPVVGVPLPLVSYGGSAMLTVMIGFGLILSAALHRDAIIPRSGAIT